VGVIDAHVRHLRSAGSDDDDDRSAS
jgi:hypothetical protein